MTLHTFTAPRPIPGEMQTHYLMRVVAAFEDWANSLVEKPEPTEWR